MDRIRTSFIATLIILFFGINAMEENKHKELFEPLASVTEIAPDHETCIKQKILYESKQQLYQDAKKIMTLKNNITFISFSPDSSKVLFNQKLSNNTSLLRVCETKTGNTIFEYSDQDFGSFAFLNDNNTIFCRLPDCLIELNKKKIHKLETAGRTIIGFYKIEDHELQVPHDVSFNSFPLLISLGASRRILVTNLAGEGVQYAVDSISKYLTPSNFTVNESGDAIAWYNQNDVWVLKDIGKDCKEIGPFTHSSGICSVALMKSDKIVSGTDKLEGAIHIWDIMTGAKLLKLQVTSVVKECVPSVRLPSHFNGDYSPITKLSINEQTLCAEDGFGKWRKADVKAIQRLIEEKKDEQRKE
ncbi:hypothetical protein HYX58_01090 [Candidatus Dependentiae bacterium]|nr:hypothetical protein [Candidatus Dependentiae bacterium]